MRGIWKEESLPVEELCVRYIVWERGEEEGDIVLTLCNERGYVC